ncbi:hypothetical protein BKA69DRAFT_893459 [Paraphysoderma sedebokerense]|nr:hypothetical protein BKA69DRAFT_893459 [Paraphysoderma sedebokerense]
MLLSLNKSIATFPTLSEDSMTSTSYDGSYDPIPSMISIADDDPVPAYLQPAHRAPLSSLTGQTRFPLPNLNSSSNSSSSQSLHISKSENGSAYNSFYNDSYNLADTNSAPQMVRKTAHILHLAPEMKSSLGFARVSLRAPKKRRVNESKTEIRFLKESQHLQDREGEIKSRKGDSSAQFGVELQTPSDVLRREVGTTLDPSKSNGNILTPWTESTHSTSENPGTYHYDIPPTEVGNEASIQKGKVGNPKSLPNQTESHDSKTKIIRDSYQSSKSSQSSATTARLAHSRLPASQFNSPTHTYAAAQDTSRPNKPKSKSSIPRYRSSLNSSSQSSNFATSAILPPQPTQKAKPYDVKAVREFMKRKKLEQKLKPPVNADNLNDILKPLHVVPEPNDKSKKKPYDPNKVQEYIKSKENSRLAEIQRLEEAKAEEERKRRERLKKLDEFRRQQRIKKERKMEKERQIRREMEEIERKRLGAIGAAEYEGRQEGTKEDDALKAASGDIGTTDASADQGLPYTAAVNSLLIPAINVNGSSSNSIDDISESRHTSSSNSPSASSSDFAPAVESKLPSVEKGEDRSQPSAKEESSIRSNSPVIDVGSLKLPEVPESIPNPPDSVPSSLPHQRKPVNSVPAGYMDEAVTVNKKHSSTPPPAFNTLPTNSGEDEQVQRIQALVQTAESLQRRLKQTIELDISTLLDESEISQSSEVSAARGEVDGDLVEGVEYTSNLDGPKEDSEMDVRELGLECAGKSSQQDKIKGHSPKSTRVNSEYLAYPSFPPVSSPSEIPRLPTPSAPPLLAVSGRELNSENNSIASDLPSSSQIGRSSARAFTSISTSLINERRTPQKGGQLTPDLSRRIQHTNDHIYFHLPPADKDSMDQDPFTLFRILKRRYVSSKKRSTEVAEPKKVDESSRKERLNESKNYSSDFELVDENVDATTSEPRFVTSQELPSKTLPPTALLPEKSITEETPSPQRFIVHQDTPKLPSERSIPRQQIRSTPQQSPVNVENSLKNDFPRRFPSQSHDAKFQPETQNHHQQLRPPQPHYSPKTLSKSLWAEISLLEAISESRLQLAQIERVRDAGIFEGEREQLSSLLISNQKKHEVELDEARKQRDKIQELLKRRENEGKEKRGKAGIDNSYSETFESFESSLDSSTHERTITSSSPPTRSGSRNSARPKSQLSESVMSLSRKKKQTIRDVEKEDTKESIEKEINAEDAEARTEESFATEMIDHNNGKSSQLQVMEEAIQEEVNSNYSRSMEDSSSAAKKKDKDKEKISMVLSDRTRDLSEPFATSQNGSTRQEMEWLSAQLRSVRPQNDAIPVDVFARLCKDLSMCRNVRC